MSEQIRKHPLNVTGKYYVDFNRCAHHEYCVYNAPNNFMIDPAEHFGAYVSEQPSTLKKKHSVVGRWSNAQAEPSAMTATSKRATTAFARYRSMNIARHGIVGRFDPNHIVQETEQIAALLSLWHL